MVDAGAQPDDDRGRAERAELDRRSDKLAEDLLGGLTPSERDRLVAAMGEVERLLVASTVRVGVIDPGHPHARFCLGSYYAELAERFEEGFDPTLSVSTGEADLRLPHGLLLVATLDDEPVGCGALLFHPGEPAYIKRMWVSPQARGLGIAQRLLDALELHAASMRMTTLRLDTNRSLTEARALYARNGYREIAAYNANPYADHWFEKAL